MKSSAFKKSLPPKLMETEQFIKNHFRLNGHVPTLEEIKTEFGLSWTSTAQDRVNALVKKGHLIKLDRGYTLPAEPSNPADDQTSLPLIGSVAAGKPIEAVTVPDFINVPKSMLKSGGNYYCLRVKGDSMIEDNIIDGDIVIIRGQNFCENGDTVVAMVNGETTLKRYYKKKTQIELRPSNSKLKPIYVQPEDQFRIAGVYAGLIRQN